MRTGKRIGVALLAITAIALGLRITGLDRLQPHLQEPDSFLVDQVGILRKDASAEEPPHHFYAYPTALARGLATLPEPAVEGELASEALLIAHKRAAVGDLLRLRATVAWIATLLIPLTWLLARRLVGPGPALLAAALVAVSLLHLLFSQQARPHAVQATWALAGVVLAVELRRRPSWGSYVACALALALAVGTLHNGAALLLPLAAAHLLRARVQGRVPWWGAALLVVPAVLAAIVFYPRPPEIRGDGGVLEFGGHTLPFDQLDGSGFARIGLILWSYEPALLVLSGVALAALLARAARRSPELVVDARGDLLVALAYALPYLIAVGLMGLTEDRFLIPLIPFLATLVASLLNLAPGRAAVQTGLALAMLAFPSTVAARYVAVRDAPDTVEQAAAWVERNLDPERDRVLLTPRLALPLFHSAESLRIAAGDHSSRQQVWLRWQLAHLPREEGQPFAGTPRWKLLVTPGKLAGGRLDAREWLEQAGPDYAVLEVSRLMSNYPQVIELRDLIRERGTAVAVIRGEDVSECSERPLDYQDVPRCVPRMLRAQAFGPCIEIYRLER